MQSIESYAKKASKLFTLPDICLQLNQLIHQPHSSAKEIARLVSVDPAITVRILKLANSALYGFSAKITTVSQAIVVIGTGELYNIALATSAAATFNGVDGKFIDMKQLLAAERARRDPRQGDQQAQDPGLRRRAVCRRLAAQHRPAGGAGNRPGRGGPGAGSRSLLTRRRRSASARYWAFPLPPWGRLCYACGRYRPCCRRPWPMATRAGAMSRQPDGGDHYPPGQPVCRRTWLPARINRP